MVGRWRSGANEPAGRHGGVAQSPASYDATLGPALHSPRFRILRLESKTYKEIAKECDLTKYHMENCARITRLMEEAGLPEPYRRLTEKPATVSRWCSKHWLKAGDRKGGGKRRPAS